MRTSSVSESQIVDILKEAESGIAVADLRASTECRASQSRRAGASSASRRPPLPRQTSARTPRSMAVTSA